MNELQPQSRLLQRDGSNGRRPRRFSTPPPTRTAIALLQNYKNLAIFVLALLNFFLLSQRVHENQPVAGSCLSCLESVGRTAVLSGRTNNYNDLIPARQPIVLGHVHMAKTAGTEINGELASHFERVCGHKGYSCDAFQFNERVRRNPDGERGPPGDIIQKSYEWESRGRVPIAIMHEIGYEDCDWISFEAEAGVWRKTTERLGPMELHIPCREPISHLLSQCNHQRRFFNCRSRDLKGSIDRCLMDQNRFSMTKFHENENITLKCFNPIPIEGYLGYMSTRLQRKRIENHYIHRDTNKPHMKALECMKNNSELASRIREILLQSNGYYKFCDTCIGSSNDLLHS